MLRENHTWSLLASPSGGPISGHLGSLETHLALKLLKLPSLSILRSGPIDGNIVIDLMLSSVSILHRCKVQKAAKLL